MSEKKPEAGEYWEKEGVRLRVIGTKRTGIAVGEHEFGSLELFHHQHDWKHLPGCDGFNWQPEVFPQWFIRKPPRSFNYGGYVKRVEKDCAIHFQKNGNQEHFNWDDDNENLVARGDWIEVTQHHAEQTLKPPENKLASLANEIEQLRADTMKRRDELGIKLTALEGL